jgi:membrane protein YqaA with SNARE-associated domain
VKRDDIIAMAREAGWPDSLVAPVIVAKLAEFAALVAAAAVEQERKEFAIHAVDIARRSVEAEREACAKLVHVNALACAPGSMLQVYLGSNAAAIRARGQA